MNIKNIAKVTNVINMNKFFTKKKEEPSTIKTIAVVFNIANHTSLLAASLYAMVRSQLDLEVSVCLVDIRDNLPNVDKYVWVDAGTPKVLEEALKDRMSEIKHPSEEKKRIAYVHDHSTILSSEVTDMPSIASSVYGKVIATLRVEFPAFTDDTSTLGIFSKCWALGVAFEAPKVAVEDYEAYCQALRLVYDAYHGAKTTMSTLREALLESTGVASDDRLQAFMAKQQYIGSLVARKTQLDQIGDTYAYRITAMGPDVYALIRRINLSKKAYIHTSMGSYGIVVYANFPLDNRTVAWKESIVLAPEYVAKQIAM